MHERRLSRRGVLCGLGGLAALGMVHAGSAEAQTLNDFGLSPGSGSPQSQTTPEDRTNSAGPGTTQSRPPQFVPQQRPAGIMIDAGSAVELIAAAPVKREVPGGLVLFPGDVVRTGPGGSARLILQGGFEVMIGGESQALVNGALHDPSKQLAGLMVTFGEGTYRLVGAGRSPQEQQQAELALQEGASVLPGEPGFACLIARPGEPAKPIEAVDFPLDIPDGAPPAQVECRGKVDPTQSATEVLLDRIPKLVLGDLEPVATRGSIVPRATPPTERVPEARGTAAVVPPTTGQSASLRTNDLSPAPGAAALVDGRAAPPPSGGFPTLPPVSGESGLSVSGESGPSGGGGPPPQTPPSAATPGQAPVFRVPADRRRVGEPATTEQTLAAAQRLLDEANSGRTNSAPPPSQPSLIGVPQPASASSGAPPVASSLAQAPLGGLSLGAVSTETNAAPQAASPRPQTAPRANRDTNPAAGAGPAAIFRVQVGAYRNPDYARSAAAELRAKGYEVDVVPGPSDANGGWTRLRFGSFPDQASAEAAAKAFKASMGRDAIAVRG